MCSGNRHATRVARGLPRPGMRSEPPRELQPCVVVIGASAGGVEALLELAAALPARFAAAVLVVQHIGALPSILPALMNSRGPNKALHASNGDIPLPGQILIAPPDHHMLLEADVVRLTRGPKENHARPAIDPLFRSAALNWRQRAVGVILTGHLDDGAAGLAAIKACGGRALVQDPSTALEPSMPLCALASVKVDFCGSVREIAAELVRLAGAAPPAPTSSVPESVVREVAINQGDYSMENIETIGSRSELTCPDCGGSLWEMKDGPLRYRCHTGHAFTALNLGSSQAQGLEYALRSSVRALREREFLLRRVARVSQAQGEKAQAAAGNAQAEGLKRKIEQLLALLEDDAVARPRHAPQL